LVTLPKNCWPRVLGSVVIQLYAGECTPSMVKSISPFKIVLHLWSTRHKIISVHVVLFSTKLQLEKTSRRLEKLNVTVFLVLVNRVGSC